jgi:AraC-like DNA-binding protein
MKYRYQKPNPFLSNHVRTVLILEGFTPSDSTALPLVTNGMPALFCNTEKDAEGNECIIDLALCGRSIPPECLSVRENTTMVAYFFYPFMLASMFGIAARTLLAKPVDLQTWNTHQTNALKTQLAYATSTGAKVQVMDNLLIHQLTTHRRECEIVQRSTDHIMLDHGTETLSDLLKKLNINQRTFQRIFKKYVGVTPNQYRRICQFDGSFSQLRTKEFKTLSDVAYDNGFADQSHFIRSFKEFTATTPHEYLLSGLKDKKQ